jgi:hypothetical protein
MEQFLLNRDQLQFILNTLNKISLKTKLPLRFSLPIIDIIRNASPQEISKEDYDKLVDELNSLKEELSSLKEKNKEKK